jgi:hypothetical protein
VPTAQRRRPGVKVSLRQLLEHVDIQRLLSNELLQPLVLTLQLLQALGFISLHPAVLRTPTIPRRLADLQLTEWNSPGSVDTVDYAAIASG